MESVKLGIENLRRVLSVAVELGNVADKMGRTSGMAKFGHLMMLVDEVTMLGSVKFDQVLPEFKNLDAAEKQTLLNDLKTKLDLADDKLEAVIEEGVGLLVEGEQLVRRFMALGAKLKA